MRLVISAFTVFCLALALLLPAALAQPEEKAVFVGSQACAECHAEQYENFEKYSSKAHSWRSLEKMLPKLTEAEKKECYKCHTTGYGQPGGFISLERTPDKANLGCEACHGPGSLHCESGDTELIQRTPDVEGCITCHNAERIQNFKFKPTLYHGGH